MSFQCVRKWWRESGVWEERERDEMEFGVSVEKTWVVSELLLFVVIKIWSKCQVMDWISHLN